MISHILYVTIAKWPTLGLSGRELDQTAENGSNDVGSIIVYLLSFISVILCKVWTYL